MTSARPPARAIFSAAVLLNRCAFTTIAFVSSPSPSTLTPANRPLTRPSLTRRSGVMSRSSVFSAPTLTTAYSLRNRWVTPRFGTRLWSGIWPPSKPKYCFRPERDSCPLLPAVAVLPWPDPGPRPIRFGFLRAPLAGLSVDRSSLRAMPALLDDPHQMPDGIDHAPHRGIVRPHHGLVRVAKTQGPQHPLLSFRAGDAADVLEDRDRPGRGRAALSGARPPAGDPPGNPRVASGRRNRALGRVRLRCGRRLHPLPGARRARGR